MIQVQIFLSESLSQN